jgi:uncharacterized delta-60 repeat protein
MSAPRLLGVFAAITAAAIAASSAFAEPGAIDRTFGTDGVTTSQFGDAQSGGSATTSAAIAPNGDIYEAGLASTDASGDSSLYLARYLPSGKPDHSFGVGGVSLVQIGQGSTPESGSGASVLRGQHIAFTPSGDIVVPTAGTDAAGNTQIAVVEFKPTGALDTSFAPSGPMPGVYYDDSTSTPTSDTTFGGAAADAAVVQSDGKIVFSAVADPAGGPETFVRRLDADGTVDTSFGSGGTYTAPAGVAGAPAQINDIILNSTGNIVFAGGTHDPTAISELMLGELNTHGTIAPGFPRLFQASPAAPGKYSVGYSVVQAADGDYIVGASSLFSQNFKTAVGDQGWVAVAFRKSGSPDSSFGGGNGIAVLGPATVSNCGSCTQLAPLSIAQQANGRFVFTGLAAPGGGFTVARTLANGVVDPSFGSDGVESYAFSGLSTARSLAIAADGQLVLGGQSTEGLLESSGILTKIILDSPPALAIAAGPAVAGEPVTFSAITVSDSPVSSIKWDLGSGTLTDATGPTATKTFPSPGTYTVRAQASDDDHISSTVVTERVTVAAPTPPLPPGYCTRSTRPTATITVRALSRVGLIIAGTAAAHCPSVVRSVSVAIARTKRKKCSFLSTRHRWGNYGQCTPRTYLPASGTYAWGFGLQLRFLPATYWVWKRATDSNGVSTRSDRTDHLALKLH